MPCSVAMAGAVQCVVSPGGLPDRVACTTRASISAPSGARRPGRVLSRNRPATPSVMNRSCQRQTAVLLVPLPRIISAVPKPSAVKQDYPRPPDMLLRTVPIRHNCLKSRPILGFYFNFDSIEHPKDLLSGGRMGILNRTQTRDFTH